MITVYYPRRDEQFHEISRELSWYPRTAKDQDIAEVVRQAVAQGAYEAVADIDSDDLEQI